LAATAAAQHGVFNLAQVVACGYNLDWVKRTRRSRRIERILPGVYRIAGSPPSWAQNVWAAVLWAGACAGGADAAAAAWGSTAARLHGFAGFPDTPIEIATCFNKISQHLLLPDGTSIKTHRVDKHRFKDVQLGSGIPCTSIRHTILDLLGRKRAVRTLDDALFRDPALLGQLHFLYEMEWTRGRRGIAILRTLLLDRHPGTAPTQSDLEDLFRSIVEEFGLPRPESQYPVELDGGTYRVDFAYPLERIAIECDGYAWHGDRTAFERDRERDVELQGCDWAVVRFTWAKLRFERPYVAEKVRHLHRLRQPTAQ
jgi:hypothetical protein